MNVHNARLPHTACRPLVAMYAATSLLLAAAGAVYAAGGVLDTTFGAGGITLVNTTGSTPLRSDLDSAVALAVQPDGKIVAVGDRAELASGTGPDFKLMRYNTDGSLDATFGAGGVVVLAFSTGSDHPWDLVLQPDGKIVAVGYTAASTTSMLAARVNTDGSLDTTFGSGGYVTVAGATAYAAAIQSDGKIVLAGESNGRFVLARLLPANGALDPTFGAGGTVTVSPGSQLTVQLTDVKLQVVSGEARIVVAGQFRKGGKPGDFGLMRLRASGAVDTTFGSAGSVQTDVAGNADKIFEIAIDASNRIVAAGSAAASGGANTDFAIVRYTASGAVDTTFGAGGKQRTDFAGLADYARSVTIQSDGKIVVCGQVDNGSSYDLGLARYTSSGALDTTFGYGGRVQLDVFGLSDYVFAVVTQTVTNPDTTTRERLLVGGTSNNGTGYDTLVAAFEE
jgi:uncharacterized delta-60 repeat protein